MKKFKERWLEEKLVIARGIIPKEDIAFLKKIGIREIFNPGTATREIMDFIKKEFS